MCITRCYIVIWKVWNFSWYRKRFGRWQEIKSLTATYLFGINWNWRKNCKTFQKWKRQLFLKDIFAHFATSQF